MSKTLDNAIKHIESKEKNEFLDSHQAVNHLFKTLLKKDYKRVIKFPYEHMNKRLRGIFPTSFIVIGADTGCGKSELLGQIAHRASIDGKRVMYFDFENDDCDIYARIITRKLSIKIGKDFTVADLKLSDIETGEHSKEIYEICAETAQECETLSLYRNDEIPTVERFVEMLESIKDDVDLVCIDHLHYFDFEKSQESQSIQISKVMRALNRLTRKRIPIILASHLKQRIGKEKAPTNYDLFGSSNIAKEAKAVILMHREDQHTVFQITKNREGVYLSKYNCKFKPIGREFVFEYNPAFND